MFVWFVYLELLTNRAVNVNKTSLVVIKEASICLHIFTIKEYHKVNLY